MNKQTIFDSWITYPSIFLKSTIKKNVVKPLVVVEKKISICPFFLCPNKSYNNDSTINILKTYFGKTEGKINTFQTGFISIIGKTQYNGHEFKLKITNNSVILEILINNSPVPLSCWDIKKIVSTMKRKNPKNRTLTKKYVSNLLLEGKLRVRFNVSKTKDHGTQWKVF